MVAKGEMRDPMTKKFVLLPFSISCVSPASVAVLEQRARRSRSDFRSSSLGSHEEEEEGEERILGESMRHSSRFSRPNLSNGVNKLMKGFKNLSQLFNEEEMEELGMEMEIGCPTDVKHVTHIGWDSLITNSNAVSLKQFQLPTSSALQSNLQTFEKTRDRMENFLLVPITMGCVSQANLDVGGQHTIITRSKSDLTLCSSRNQLVEDVEESISCESMRHSSRPNISTGVNRLMKGFKSLSQLFVYEDEMEEMGMEMEIGCPTEVKHVTHIGSDGLATNINPLMEWDKLIIPELLSQSSMNKFKLPASATVN